MPKPVSTAPVLDIYAPSDEREFSRFVAKVALDDVDACWLWTGALTGGGYGRLQVKRDGRWRVVGAHVLSHEYVHGPIPEGHDVDHLCRVRACVNPRHLRALTVHENRSDNGWSARTHCDHGHEFTPENTAWRNNGKGLRVRKCMECERIRARRNHARRTGKVAA